MTSEQKWTLGGHAEPVANILRARFARRSAGAGLVTKDVFAEHDCDFFDEAAEFDERYGGLEMAGELHGWDGAPISDPWTADSVASWLFGAAACVAAGSPAGPYGDDEQLRFYGNTLGLIPVARGPVDDVWYLDRVGRGYFHDTIGDLAGPHLVATNPRQLFARIILTSWCLKRLGARFDGFVGEEFAAYLDLERIAEATDETERWWGRDLIVVCERFTLPGEGYPVRRMTMVGVGDEATLAQVRDLV